MKDAGDKIKPEDRMAIESASNDLKKALESNDAAGIKRTLEALDAAQMKAGQNLYASAPGADGAPGAPGSEGGAAGAGAADGDVIDAEVVEEKK